MENNIENPPAFPDLATKIVGPNMTEQVRQSGMTLRDYFAAKAMAKLMTGKMPYDSAEISKSAYTMADAMLKERKQ